MQETEIRSTGKRSSEGVRTYSRLFLATKWNIIIQDIILIDPDLSTRKNQHSMDREDTSAVRKRARYKDK
jgi:hypothetical protein